MLPLVVVRRLSFDPVLTASIVIWYLIYVEIYDGTCPTADPAAKHRGGWGYEGN